MGDSDADLVRGFDDAEIFERFVRRHLALVYRYVVRRIGVQDADAITNDVFLTAFRRRDSFRSDVADARPWR